METSVAGKEILRKGVQVVIGYICALPSFMGYYPLIPAYFALIAPSVIKITLSSLNSFGVK